MGSSAVLAHDARMRSSAAASRQSMASPYLFSSERAGRPWSFIVPAGRSPIERRQRDSGLSRCLAAWFAPLARNHSCIAPCAAPRSFRTTLDKLECALSRCSKGIYFLTFLRCSAISPPVRPDVAGEQGDMSRTQGCVGKPACNQGQPGGGGSGSTRRFSHCPPGRTPNRPRAGRATEFHPSMPMAPSSHSGNGARVGKNLTGGTFSWRMTTMYSDCRR